MRGNSFTALAAGLLLGSAAVGSYAARPLGHDDFDNWKNVVNRSLSHNGEWAAYQVDPQEGDGVLTFRNTGNGKQINIERGYRPLFTADGNWAVALIKAPFAETRQAKIKKKKDHELPSDSLAIVDLRKMKVTKVADVIDFKIAKDAGTWVAFTSRDTSLVAPKYLADKECGRPLVLFDLPTGIRRVTKWVRDFSFSDNGHALALTVKRPESDSLATNSVGVITLPDTCYTILDRDKPFYGVPVLDRMGKRLAFTASSDTAKSGTLNADVYLCNLDRLMDSPYKVEASFKTAQGEMLRPNQFTRTAFSYNGRRLIAGVAPVIAPDDTTIVDFENGKLDIWRWDAPLTPPQESHYLEEFKKASFPAVFNLSAASFTGLGVLVTDNYYSEVEAPDRWDGNWALVRDPEENIVSYQWDYFAPTTMRLVNLENGEALEVGEFERSNEANLSAGGKYVVWFKDRQWYLYDIAARETRCITENIPYPVWDTDDEHPSPSIPFGIGGWADNDDAVLIYDRHDIWKVDPLGKTEPICLTAGEGRKRNIRFRVIDTDKDVRSIAPDSRMLLSVFDYADKYNGLATLKYGKPQAPAIEVLDGHAYTQIRKAKNAEVFTWQRANFSELPELWLSKGTKFANATQLTDAHPDSKEYSWGTARLERWYAYDGAPSDGVLYVPDNIDPDKKYPMLCVFYETGSEDLYTHYTMQPSWSWVNYPFYVSRGYVIFVPDINYTSGRPGEDAYNYVCSGVEEMCRRYPWIDKDRIGIDGQSWGGYQTAYLVTRTDMFACAGSGAPVSNMTSAYGGIRWESGDSRQAQYEQGQSRIGGDLWSMRDFYVANSPLFRADRVNTPLLIMHNDADGAVPWYQGIEYFMALRRLGKPVWMLQYNGEAHNIKARKNRKDITRRLQQFFDHYLKDDPMPKWMKKGVPMLRKGQEWGFETE